MILQELSLKKRNINSFSYLTMKTIDDCTDCEDLSSLNVLETVCTKKNLKITVPCSVWKGAECARKALRTKIGQFTRRTLGSSKNEPHLRNIIRIYQSTMVSKIQNVYFLCVLLNEWRISTEFKTLRGKKVDGSSENEPHLRNIIRIYQSTIVSKI